jgi:hypothetical protein
MWEKSVAVEEVLLKPEERGVIGAERLLSQRSRPSQEGELET